MLHEHTRKASGDEKELKKLSTFPFLTHFSVGGAQKMFRAQKSSLFTCLPFNAALLPYVHSTREGKM
jgi:hypothetical protein